MQVSEDTILTGQLIQNMDKHMSTERPGGVHVSDLLFCLRKAVARRHGYFGELSPSTLLLFATGRAIQAYLTGASEDAPAVQLDGIWGTPDQLVGGSPVEYKATYMSAARDIQDSPHYFQQLASYCKMQGVTEGVLVVFYVNGYYDFQRKTPRPGALPGERSVLKAWRVEFSAMELAVWWEEMFRRKQVLEEALLADIPNPYDSNPFSLEERINIVPLSEHWTWECKECPLLGNLCPGGDGTYDQRRLGHAG